MTILKIIDSLTGYKELENFDSITSFDYEIQHSPLKISNSLKKLIRQVKTKQIKYIKISTDSVLNTDFTKNSDSQKTTSTRHYFDFLMSNMVYDIIKNCDNSLLTNWYIKKYMFTISDVIEDFEKFPYDADDFNRMNYGIFINDSKEYGGNCQIFSMIFELIFVCKKFNKFTSFINLCSDKKIKKYYEILFNNFDKLLYKHSQKLNLMFWLVSLDIMMQLNKINENAYVISNSLLESGFIINNKNILIKKDIRQSTSESIDSILYACEKHCHVGYKTEILIDGEYIIFDIDNVNFPTNESEFINRACNYYDFNISDITKYYYHCSVFD